jgi:oxygen-independent coproporphyrinogen-3 oxidase
MQIYIHIPFCEQKCNYCRFASTWKIQNLHIEKYVNFLCEEIKNQKSDIFHKRNKNIIETIYFWWWTPWVLNLKQFEKIFKTIKNNFFLDKNCEISIETTPDKISEENLIWWKKLWINRISIWVQTLNEKSLKEIWRWEKWDILKALKNIKNNLIKNISLDFIIWLPYVKKWEILENIKFILNNYNFIKHISIYMLEDYYSADKIIETKYDNITYPKIWGKLWLNEEDFLEEYSNIKSFLLKKWFVNYEISNFAKSWYESRHNKWYWNHKEVFAFGMWAWWYVNWLRYLNADNFKDYYAWKKIFEEKLDKDNIFLEKVMFWLRTSWLKKEFYKKLNQEKITYFIKNW